MIVLLIVFLGLLVISNIYIAMGLNIVLLNYLNIKPLFTTTIYILFVVLLVLAFIPNINTSSFIDSLGMYFLSFVLYALMFYLISDIVVFFLKYILKSNTENLRSLFLLISTIVSFLVIVYGTYNANKIELVNYDANIGLDKNLKAILISDIHLGAVKSEERMPRIVETINAQNPDIVFMAGDIFDSNFHSIRNREEAIKNFKNIKSKLGVYACIGNHDAGKTFEDMRQFLKDANVKLLLDEYIRVDDFIVGGRIDGTPIGTISHMERSDEYSVPSEFKSKNLPVIVMDHNPININKYDETIDLILSGHTHKGQLFPANIITNIIYEVDYGYYEKKNGTKVIVSSGVGTWGMPVRVGSNCEVVVINIK